MATVATLLLTNAVLAMILALPALLVSRLGRRPALAHALWLLVLLKLVTPPFVDVPVPWQVAEPEVHPAPLPAVAAPTTTPTVEGFLAVEEPQDGADFLERHLVVIDEHPIVQQPAPPPLPPSYWPVVLVALSLTGSVGWLLLALLRIRGFRRLLRFATPAPPGLAGQVAELTRRLELTQTPTVWLVPGRLSPLVWGLLGRPWLLVPAELWAKLSRPQQETLLLHELAHLKRRDHHVRLLELLVTALYWWHPIVWLARRELRAAEEQCCDAWVVWAQPGAAKSYATALLECLDFLSQVSTPLPLGASGIGQVADLKRRLTMIMGRSTPRRLTVSGGVLVLVLAAMLLPTMPTFGQTSTPPARKPPSDDPEKVKAEVEKLKSQLEEQLQKAHETEKRLRETVEKLNRIEQASGSKRDVRVIIIREGERGTQTAPGGGTPGLPGMGQPRPQGQTQGQGGGWPTGPGSSGGGGWPTGPSGSGGSGWGTARPPQPQPQGGDRRIEDLEKKLDNVLRELEEVRRQMQRNQRPGSGPGPMGPGGPGPMGPGGMGPMGSGGSGGMGPMGAPMGGSGTGPRPGSKSSVDPTEKKNIEIELELKTTKKPSPEKR